MSEIDEAEHEFWAGFRVLWIPRAVAVLSLSVLLVCATCFFNAAPPPIAQVKPMPNVHHMALICKRGMEETDTADRGNWYKSAQTDYASGVTMMCYDWLVRDPSVKVGPSK